MQKIAHKLMRFHPFIYDVKTKGYNEIDINVFLRKVLGLFTKRFISSLLYYWAELFEGRLALNPGLNFNPGLFFFPSKAFSLKIFSILFRVANRQIVDKKN